ncbi:MAG: FcoT family thioesterase [Pseudomonadota bacterium]
MMSQAVRCEEAMHLGTSAIEGAFIDRVLEPYRDHCRYLQGAYVVKTANADAGNAFACEGAFSIPKSCYIDDTGHFNAVEFNICYNQLAYVFLARGIELGFIPELGHFTLDSFHEKKLSNFLIMDIRSRYSAPIDASMFQGRVEIVSARSSRKCVILKMACTFRDAGAGRAKGEVTLGILHP